MNIDWDYLPIYFVMLLCIAGVIIILTVMVSLIAEENTCKEKGFDGSKTNDNGDSICYKKVDFNYSNGKYNYIYGEINDNNSKKR
jgi:hypothetical protein